MLLALQPPGTLLLFRFRYVSKVTGKRGRAHTPRPPPHDPPGDPPKEPVDDPPPWEPPPKEQPPDETTDLHPFERALTLYFLRRYITWCARRRQFAAMNGAVLLYRRLTW